MLNIQRILCPTDLSACAQHALPVATRFAQLHGADLHLLHVQVLHSEHYLERRDPYPGEKAARLALEEAVPEIAWGEVYHETVQGVSAGQAILGYAEEHDVDMIVMGSHGRRGVRRLLLGSVTEEVVRLAKCPVLVVRLDEKAAPLAVDKILLPVDFSTHTSLAVGVARELASAFGANVDLLHAVELPLYPETYLQNASRPEVLRQEAEDRLARLAETMELDRTPGVGAVIGRASGEVIEAAEKGGYDLIVMPSHGYTGYERTLLGSVAERVLRQAPCPVLVLKGDGKELRPDEPLAAVTDEQPVA
ncbi:MAG: universal stress protein [Gemmatimonadota bacterium]